MADGTNQSVALIAEATNNQTPANPTFLGVRHTSCNIGLTRGGDESKELRGDRQITGWAWGPKKIEGDIGFEMVYDSTQQSILEALLCGTWARKATITAATISAAAIDNSYNDSGNGFLTAGFATGDRVIVTGFTGNVLNNITTGVITNAAAGKLIIGGTDGDVIVDDAAGESVTITTHEYVLKVGSTRRSFTVERHFSDLVEADCPYHRFRGMEFNKASIKIAATDGGGARVTGTFSLVGRDLDDPAGTAIAGSTYPAVTTTQAFTGFVGSVLEGGSSLAIATEITLDIDNGMMVDHVLFDEVGLRPSLGFSNINGQLTLWFENETTLQKFIDKTDSALVVTLTDAATNSLKIDLPLIRYTGGGVIDVNGAGRIPLTMPFQAFYLAASASNIVVTRDPAA